MTSIAIAVVLTFAVSCMLTCAARVVAPRLGFVDIPDGQRKNHAAPTPLLGGAAIYFSVVMMLVAGHFFDSPLSHGSEHLTGLISSCSLFFFLGLLDDKRPLNARQKFVGQILASLPFALWGQTITSIGFFGFDVSLGYWGVAATVLWLVTCSNIINLVDGLDGLASCITLIILLTIGTMAWSHGNAEQAFFAFVVCAAICGFLVQNLPPARIFLGDSGSLMLGFLVGAFAMESTVKRATVFTLVSTIVIVSVPFFDTAMAILRRKLRGKRIGEADRGHIHHRLQDMGLSRRQTLVAIVSLSFAMAIVAFVAEILQNDYVAVLLCVSLLASLVVARVFGHYEAVMLGRHIKAVGALSLDLLRISGSCVMMVRLQDHEVTNECSAWDMVCERIARQGIQSLELSCCDSDDQVIGCLDWQCESSHPDEIPDWVLNFSGQVEGDITTYLILRGNISEGEALRAANDLFIFCGALCHNQAMIECAIEEFQARKELEPDIIPFPTKPDQNLLGQEPSARAA